MRFKNSNKQRLNKGYVNLRTRLKASEINTIPLVLYSDWV